MAKKVEEKKTTKKEEAKVEEKKFFEKVKDKAKSAGSKTKEFVVKHKKGFIAGAGAALLAGAGAIAAKKFLGGNSSDADDEDGYDYDEAEDAIEEEDSDFLPDVDEETEE